MNIKTEQYIILILIPIICIMSGFLIYETYFQSTKEGLENRIKRQDGKIIKRRKKNKRKNKEPVREGLFNPFSEIINGFKRMIGFVNMLVGIGNYLRDLFRYLFDYINRIVDNVKQSFMFVPSVFVWLASVISGGLKFIINLPKCYMWYFLEAFGQLLYLPIRTLFWMFNLQSIETMAWEFAEKIDCMAKKFTGYHLIHYSNDIQDRCYSFCPDEFPKFPGLEV